MEWPAERQPYWWAMHPCKREESVSKCSHRRKAAEVSLVAINLEGLVQAQYISSNPRMLVDYCVAVTETLPGKQVMGGKVYFGWRFWGGFSPPWWERRSGGSGPVGGMGVPGSSCSHCGVLESRENQTRPRVDVPFKSHPPVTRFCH